MVVEEEIIKSLLSGSFCDLKFYIVVLCLFLFLKFLSNIYWTFSFCSSYLLMSLRINSISVSLYSG